jgi:hypothetical protein
MDGYVTVPERIALFYKRYPEGSLQMDPPVFTEVEGKHYVIGRAYAYRTPDDPRPGIGTAWEIVPGTTPFTRGSEIMNLETSSWGRAIGSLNIGIDKSVATWDEIEAAKARKVEVSKAPTPVDDQFYTIPPEPQADDAWGIKKPVFTAGDPITSKQIGMLKGALKKKGAESSDAGLGMINDHLGTSYGKYEDLKKGEGSDLIKHFMT